MDAPEEDEEDASEEGHDDAPEEDDDDAHAVASKSARQFNSTASPETPQVGVTRRNTPAKASASRASSSSSSSPSHPRGNPKSQQHRSCERDHAHDYPEGECEPAGPFPEKHARRSTEAPRNAENYDLKADDAQRHGTGKKLPHASRPSGAGWVGALLAVLLLSALLAVGLFFDRLPFFASTIVLSAGGDGLDQVHEANPILIGRE